MNITPISKVFLLIAALSFSACSMLDDMASKKPANSGLIATPASYYSTAKARYLASKYKDNLDRLVERITRNPKTSSLQFANNISSVGGIGFFTHSATTTPDERYLEVVLATPETFELKGEYSEKVHRLFSRYGVELLGTLTNDGDVYQDRDLSGYGLNLAWRNMVAEPAGNRVSLERAVIYFPKERVRNFVRHELSENDLLRDAVIFAVEEDGPLNLVSYKPPEPRPDFRPAIREDNLVATPAPSKAAGASATNAALPVAAPNNEPRSAAAAKSEPAVEKVPTRTASVKSSGETKDNAKGETARYPSVAKPTATLPAIAASKPAKEAVTESAGASQSHDSGTATSAPLPAETEVPNIPKPTSPVGVAKSSEFSPANTASATVPVQKLETSAVKEAAVVDKPSATSANAKKSDVKVEPVAESASRPSLDDLPAKPIVVETEKKPEPVSPPQMVEAPKAAVEPQKVAAKITEKPAAPAPLIAKAETRPMEKSSVPEVVKPLAPPKSMAQKTPEIASSTVPAAKTTEATPPVEVVKPRPIPSAQKDAAPPPAVEDKPVPAVSRVAMPVPVAPTPDAPRPVDAIKPTPPTSVAKVETPKPVEVKSLPVAPMPVPPAKSASTEGPVERAMPKELPSSAKAELAPAPEVKTAPAAIQTPPQKVATEKPAGEQLALLREKPVEITPVKPAVARPAPKALEGFIIQLAFSDKDKAQRWAESMEKRGYAVSLTEAGTEGSLRVRLGNFAVRDEAEKQLKNFKQDGLNGIVINLPQAFRPESRTSIP